MKIRTKLTLWFTALVAIIVSVGILWGWLGLRTSVYHQSEIEVRDKQKEIQAFIVTVSEAFKQQNLAFDLRENIRNLDQIFTNDQTSRYDNIFIQLTDTQGHIISRSHNLGPLNLPLHPPVSYKNFCFIHLQSQTGKDISILYSFSPIEVNGKTVGYLQLGLSMNKIESFLQQIFLFDSLTLLFSIFLSLFLGQWLAQRALSPMLQITEQVRKMAGQALFRPLDISQFSRDEIGILAETFNGLMQRIESVFIAQQRFLADASHEFKTPLTAIRSHAQLLEKRGASHPEILKKSAMTIMRECTRLTRLIDDLLLLARLEGHAEKMEQVNLGQLLEEIFEDLSPLHPQLKLMRCDERLKIWGNSDSLYRVFLNLLDNAFKTKGHTEITVTLQSQPKEALVQIHDDGPGIPSQHLPHIFERFYRVEPDRNRRSGGSGIGLALVAEVVKLHQGTIQVESKPGEGTTFTLRFPLVSTWEN